MSELQVWVDLSPGPPATIEEGLDRRAMLAELSDDEWMRAYVRHERAIIAHPLFAKLVREVAVAEQELYPPGFRRRVDRVYTYTYGSWMSRGNEPRRTAPLQRRARVLSAKIATDLGREGADAAAAVYVAARDYVRTRQLPEVHTSHG